MLTELDIFIETKERESVDQHALLNSVYAVLTAAKDILKNSDLVEDGTGRTVCSMVDHAMQLIVDFEN